jgi:hypothetical protein
VIKTIPLDLWISFVLGLVFALSAAPLLAKEESIVNTYFVRAMVFQVLVFVPIGLFLAWKWTAWSWMYIINPMSHSRYWTLFAVLCYIPAMKFGFHIAYMCIRAGKKAQAYWYLGTGVLAIGIISFGMFGRLYRVSNAYIPLKMVHTAPGWFGSGWFLLSMIIIIAIFFGGIAYILKLNAADRNRIARQAFSSPVK